MVANLLCNWGICELPCVHPQPVLISKMQLFGKDMKYCIDLQDLRIFWLGKNGRKEFSL